MKLISKENELTIAIVVVAGLLVVLVSLVAYKMMAEPSTKPDSPVQSSSLPKQDSYRNNQVAQSECRKIIIQKFVEYGEQVYSWQVDYNSSFYQQNLDEFKVFYNLIVVDSLGAKQDNWASCRINALDYSLIEFQTKKR